MGSSPTPGTYRIHTPFGRLILGFRQHEPKLQALLLGEPRHRAAVEALFAVSYRVKFAVKRGAGGIDYGVMPLEGLWWVDDMSTFSVDDKSNWSWTAMIMQPDVVTDELVQRSILEASKKKPLPAATELRLDRFGEGRAAQVLHMGPYSAERPTIERSTPSSPRPATVSAGSITSST